MAERSRRLGSDKGFRLGWPASLGYTAVTFLAIMGGFFSTQYNGPNVILVEEQAYAIIRFCVAILVLSLGAFHARCIVIDADSSVPDDAGQLSSVADFILFMIGSIWAFVEAYYISAAFAFCIVTFSVSILLIWIISHEDYCYYILRFNFRERPKKNLSEEEASFIPKVFFPALAMSSLSFLLGWGIRTPTFDFFVCFSIYSAYLVVLAVICIRRQISLPQTLLLVSAYPAVCAIFSGVNLLASVPYINYIFRPELGFALVWTYVMGVFEVLKRPHMLSTGKIHSDEDSNKIRGLEFYEGGANWATVVVSHLPLLLIFMVESSSLVIFSISSIAAALSWLF